MKDEEKTVSEETKAVDALTDNPIAAASDVTLTSDVADKELLLEPTAEETGATDTSEASAPITADSLDELVPPNVPALDGHTSETEEPSAEPESESTIYIDITGSTFIPQQPSKRETVELEDDQIDQEEMREEQKTHEEHASNETVDSSSNLETSQAEIVEAEEQASEGEVQPDENEIREQSTADDVQLMSNVKLEIDVPESEDDDRDSPSVFSTCDEWLESPGSGRMKEDQDRCVLDEDITDAIAGLDEPDEIDPPPMAPRSRGPGIEAGLLLQPAPATSSAYSHGDIPKSDEDQKSAKVCFHSSRGTERNAGDRPASSHSAGSSSTNAPRHSKRRPQSATAPHLGGRIPSQSGRAPPTSKSAPRPTPVPSCFPRTSIRPCDNPPTRCNPPPQPRDRARTIIKPILQKGRKPAWK